MLVPTVLGMNGALKNYFNLTLESLLSCCDFCGSLNISYFTVHAVRGASNCLFKTSFTKDI